MIVRRLYLKDFLSYGEADVVLKDNLNVVTGENAAGKTNLADAVFLAAIGKSSRGYRDKDLIRWGAEGGARIKLLIEKECSKHTVEIYIDPLGKRRILIDDLPILKLGELFGVLNVVFFSPDEMKLVKESPDYRRRFMDISLTQLKKRYYYELIRYNKLLAERNTLLKSPSADRKALIEMVTRQMIPSAKFVTDERAAFLKELTGEANLRHLALSGGKETLELRYQMESGDEKDWFARFMDAYPRDVELRYTSVGPHRDDVKIMAGGADVRKFGSQGQQRTAVLSMKLAEAELFQKRTGETPILLLDDVLSELDRDRINALIEAVKGYQTLVTCTRFPDGAAKHYHLMEVKNHKIRSEER